MKGNRYCLMSEADDNTLLQMARRMVKELELRGLPDLSFKQGYKAGFLAALRDENLGPGHVWNQKEVRELFKELDRRFAA